jgi:hypothetical protein
MKDVELISDTGVHDYLLRKGRNGNVFWAFDGLFACLLTLLNASVRPTMAVIRKCKVCE